MKRNNAEEQHQRWLADYLDRTGARWCHVPNGGGRSKAEGGALKAQGVKRGVPDVLIFTPPPAVPDARGAAIELKAKGARVSPEQRAWLEGLRFLGWEVAVCVGWPTAKAQLDAWGYRA